MNRLIASTLIAVGLVLGGTAVGVATSDTDDSGVQPTTTTEIVVEAPTAVVPSTVPPSTPSATSVTDPVQQPRPFVQEVPQPVDPVVAPEDPNVPAPPTTTLPGCLKDTEGKLVYYEVPGSNCQL